MKFKHEFEDFFLNKKNLNRIKKKCFFIEENICTKHETETKETKDTKHYAPETKDTKHYAPETKYEQVLDDDKLFWYWYFFNNGQVIGNKYTLEMKIKTNLAEKIHSQKKQLKIFKFKISEIEQDILYSKKISIKSIMIILHLSKINFVYYTDVVYYEYGDFDETFIIYHDKINDVYHLRENIDDEIKNNRYIITSLDKQIKNISYYKLADVKEICNKLDISTIKMGKKSFTKKELYEKLVLKLN